MNTTVETALMQLTGQEYGTVARLIKGDPRHALDSPDSTLFADALAGVCLVHARRTSPGQSWETWRAKTITELTTAYRELEVWRDETGHIIPAPTDTAQADPGDPDDQDAPDVDQLAAETAGAPLDPTVTQA